MKGQAVLVRKVKLSSEQSQGKISGVI